MPRTKKRERSRSMSRYRSPASQLGQESRNRGRSTSRTIVLSHTKALQSNRPEKQTKEIPVAVLQDSQDARILVVDDIPIKVRKVTNLENGNVQYGVLVEGAQEEVPVLFDPEESKIITNDVAVGIESVSSGVQTFPVDTLTISTTPAVQMEEIPTELNEHVIEREIEHSKKQKPTQKRRPWWEWTKTGTIIVLIAVIISLLGKTDTQCIIEQQSDPDLIAEKDVQTRFPELTALGLKGAFKLGNLQILETFKNAVTKKIQDEAIQKTLELREAFEFGTLTERMNSAKGLQEINDRLQIYKKGYKSLVKAVRGLSHDSDVLLDKLEKTDDILMEPKNEAAIERILNQRNSYTSQLGDNLVKISEALSNSSFMVDRLTAELIHLRGNKETDQQIINDLKKERDKWKEEARNLTAQMEELSEWHKNETEIAVNNNAALQSRFETLQQNFDAYAAAAQKNINEARLEGRKEMKTALEATVATLQQRINLVEESANTFTEWQRPYMDAQKTPDGRWTVRYDEEKVRRFSPVGLQYYNEASRQLESYLNNQRPEFYPPTVMSVTVRHNATFWQKVNPLYALGIRKSEAVTDFEMVTVGSTRSAEEGKKTAPYQNFRILPLNLKELPLVQQKIKNATMTITRDVTTTVSTVKSVTFTSTSTSTSTSTVAPSTPVTPSPSQMTSSDIINLLRTETVERVTETELPPSQISASISTHFSEEPTLTVSVPPTETEQIIKDDLGINGEVSSDIVVSQSVPIEALASTPTVFVTETQKTISYSTTTTLVTIIPEDPLESPITVQLPTDVIKEDVARNLEGSESSEMLVSKNEASVEQVQTTLTKCSGMYSTGYFPVTGNLCLQDRFKLLDWLKEMRRQMKPGDKVPEQLIREKNLTPEQVAYLEGKKAGWFKVGTPTPFDWELTKHIWNIEDEKILMQYFANDAISGDIGKYGDVKQVLSPENLAKYMELEQLVKLREPGLKGNLLPSKLEKEWIKKYSVFERTKKKNRKVSETFNNAIVQGIAKGMAQEAFGSSIANPIIDASMRNVYGTGEQPVESEEILPQIYNDPSDYLSGINIEEELSRAQRSTERVPVRYEAAESVRALKLPRDADEIPGGRGFAAAAGGGRRGGIFIPELV